MPDPYPPPMTTTYPSTGGAHTTSTPWNGTETADEWYTRHKAHVREEMLGDYPIVLPG